MPVTGWDIIDADRTPAQPNDLQPYSNRLCDNCFKRGHNVTHCQSQKICRTCDTLGHTWRECIICLKCGTNKQSSNAQSCQNCLLKQNSTCEVCNGKHDTQQCDQLWRRFHSTTKEDAATGNQQKELKQNLHKALEKDKSLYGKERFIRYSVGMFPSSEALNAASSQVRSTFSFVSIKWNINTYGDQLTVTLKGKGNTEEAKSLFKSIIDDGSKDAE